MTTPAAGGSHNILIHLGLHRKKGGIVDFGSNEIKIILCLN